MLGPKALLPCSLASLLTANSCAPELHPELFSIPVSRRVFDELRGQWKAFCNDQQLAAQQQPQLAPSVAGRVAGAQQQQPIALQPQSQGRQQVQSHLQPQKQPQQLQQEQQHSAPATAAVSAAQHWSSSLPQHRWQAHGDNIAPADASTAPAAASLRTPGGGKRGRRQRSLSVRSSPRPAPAFRLRRRLGARREVAHAPAAKPPHRDRWASSGSSHGGTSDGGSSDGEAARCSIASDASRTLSSASDGLTVAPTCGLGSNCCAALPSSRCSCAALLRGTHMPPDSMPCGSSHCSSSGDSECDCSSSEEHCRAAQHSSCRPRSTASQVKNYRAAQNCRYDAPTSQAGSICGRQWNSLVASCGL